MTSSTSSFASQKIKNFELYFVGCCSELKLKIVEEGIRKKKKKGRQRKKTVFRAQ
jgi:hypothetical protein